MVWSGVERSLRSPSECGAVCWSQGSEYEGRTHRGGEAGVGGVGFERCDAERRVPAHLHLQLLRGEEVQEADRHHLRQPRADLRHLATPPTVSPRGPTVGPRDCGTARHAALTWACCVRGLLQERAICMQTND